MSVCVYWSRIHPSVEPEIVELIGPHTLLSRHMTDWVKIRFCEGMHKGEEKTVLASDLYTQDEQHRLGCNMETEAYFISRRASECGRYFMTIKYEKWATQTEIYEIAKGNDQ